MYADIKVNLQQDPKLSVFFASILLSICGFVSLEEPLFLAVPAALLFAYAITVNLFLVYLLFFASLPFTIEYYLPNGLGTDLPAEPIMILLTGVSIVIGLHKGHKIRTDYFFYPVSIALFFHVFWVFISALYSEQSTVSLKFFFAKLWYVIPFYFLIKRVTKTQKETIALIRVLLVSLLFSIVVVLIRHASVGFSFKDVHFAVKLFYRNHVNYACLIATIIPLFLLWYKHDRANKLVNFLKIPIALMLITALYLSYTRAAMVAAFLVIPVYIIVRYKLMKLVMSSAAVILFALASFLIYENKYLDFAPDYQKTITHYKFDNLLEATVKLEDISTMERVYRWVAGAHMLVEHPYMGFGPGNFYFFYKKYTISSFRTYVSDNPEKSGMHNYYMMTLVEQGFIGLFLFLLVPICALLVAERRWHLMKSGFDRDLLMTGIMMLVIILAINFMNDMLETAKQGPFFFWALAIISISALKHRSAID